MASEGESGDPEPAAAALLGEAEPAPFAVHNPTGASSFLLVADHAGRRIPESLGNLGLSEADLALHIAWDIGVAALTEALAARLDACAVAQRYSRLLIDCNRDPARADAIPEVSDGTPIPANAALGEAAREARIAAIHAPYHAGIAGELARRDAAGTPTALIALHSFTPALSADAGERPWHAGVLYGGGDETYARHVLTGLRNALDAPVGDNQPYAMDGIDYTVPHHCFAAARPYAELEIRQDLLTTPAQIERWATLLAQVLKDSL